MGVFHKDKEKIIVAIASLNQKCFCFTANKEKAIAPSQRSLFIG
ncbi:MAG TPA: hypothetical protein V6D50_06420 [Chroococcales cyanobacterium]